MAFGNSILGGNPQGSILGGQPMAPRVPWGQNRAVTMAALGMIGAPTLNVGMQRAASLVPAGLDANSAWQKGEQDRLDREKRAAAMSAWMRSQSGINLSPEEQAIISESPEVGEALFGASLKRRFEPSGTFRQATPEEAAEYGATGGQFGPDGRFYPINPPSGMAIESDANGGFRLVQGPGAGKTLTEGQSKDTVFATRAEGALRALDPVDTALTSFPERVAENDPTGLVRSMQTPEFQQAQQAGLEFLQAILRKDTGAAITPQEQQEYGRVYLPQPGDGPQIVEQKRVSRRRALEAIKAGMPPQAILNQEMALQRSGEVPDDSAAPDAPSTTTPADPLGIR